MATLSLEQQRAIAIAEAKARLQQQAPSTPEARQAAVQERVKVMQMRDKAAADAQTMAELEERRNKRMMEWQLAPNADYRLGIMAKEFIPQIIDTVKRAGLEGGGAAIGQMAGRARGGKVGQAAGGAVGGAVGSALAQGEAMLTGEQADMKVGEIISSAISGATTTSGAKRNALSNMAGEFVRSVIDERQAPSMQQWTQAATTGYVAGKVSQAITGKQLTPQDALYLHRDNAFRALRDEGVRVNPQLLNRATGLNTVANYGATNAMMSRMNQEVYQKLVREELGLPKKALPLRPRQMPDPATGKVNIPGELDEVIERASKPYEQIRAISEDAAKEIEAWKAGKQNTYSLANKTPEEVNLVLAANRNLDALKKTREAVNDARTRMKQGDPEAYEVFKAAKEMEDTLEGQIQRAAEVVGKPKIIEQLKEGRQLLAKAFAVREATDSFGIVNIDEFARMRATEARPGRLLTGRLKQLADFAEAFSPVTQDAISIAGQTTPGVAMNYTGRQMALGHPSGLLSGGVPVASGVARDALATDLVQNMISRPQFQSIPESLLSSGARQMIMSAGRGDEIKIPFAAPPER